MCTDLIDPEVLILYFLFGSFSATRLSYKREKIVSQKFVCNAYWEWLQVATWNRTGSPFI